ncbi:MAG: rhomboid family intramembrane serine protease [Anaerolineae bacterium]|jgi:membrane associated rhomboid family serine protease
MATDPEAVRRWALVLDSQGIPYTVARSEDGGATLVVDAPYAAAASAALAAYAEENVAFDEGGGAPEGRDRGAARGIREGLAPAAVGVATGALLLAFFGVTGGFAAGSRWHAAGAASGELIRAGEIWRTVTALTLHADLAHVLANTFSWALFVSATMMTVGTGSGLWLVLLAGALGNLVNSLLRGPGYYGVGASTAVFGAVGVMAGHQLTGHGGRSRRAGFWTPLVAGLLLFVLLGTGEHTDVLAHLLGLLAGIALGALAGTLPARKGKAEWALSGSALAFVALNWWLALARWPN